MAFGQDSNNVAPAAQEKVQPSSAAMKLAYPMKKKKSAPAAKPNPFAKKC